MGFSFRKRFKIAPGLSLNLGKKGFGISAGPKGAKISLGADGKTRVSAGKGGLRYTKTLSSGKREPSKAEVYLVMGACVGLILVVIFTFFAVLFTS